MTPLAINILIWLGLFIIAMIIMKAIIIAVSDDIEKLALVLLFDIIVTLLFIIILAYITKDYISYSSLRV